MKIPDILAAVVQAGRVEYAGSVVDITVDGDRAIFCVEGLHKLWSLRSALTIPLEHITNVEHDPAQVGTWWHGVKLMGTDVPGAFAGGTFYYHGELVFWDVRHPDRTIIVSLADERYRKLIVEVADPAAVMRLFGGVIRHPHA